MTTWGGVGVDAGEGEVHTFVTGGYVTEVWCPLCADGRHALHSHVKEPEHDLAAARETWLPERAADLSLADIEPEAGQ